MAYILMTRLYFKIVYETVVPSGAAQMVEAVIFLQRMLDYVLQPDWKIIHYYLPLWAINSQSLGIYVIPNIDFELR